MNFRRFYPEFSSFLSQEMNDAFEQESYATKQPKLLLTAAVAAGKSKIDGGYDIPVLARYYMNGTLLR